MPIDLHDLFGSDTRAAMFFSIERINEMVKQEMSRYATKLAYAKAEGRVVPWDEDKTKWAMFQAIDGKTFKPWTLFDIGATPGNRQRPRETVKIPGTEWVYWHVKYAAGDPLTVYNGYKRGKFCFTTPVIIPVLSSYDRISGPTVWMSLTPSEMMTQRPGIGRARGTVLVGGLGMGWFLKKVCERDVVDKVIVVEKCPHLLKKIRPILCRMFPEIREKVKDWIAGDVYDHLGKHGDDVRHLLDIWPHWKATSFEFERWLGKVRHLWGWGQPTRSNHG